MSERVVFRWVEIEGFRGFHLLRRLNLDASAVLAVGPNGTGKTSFFDALQWLLLGSLERLERVRVRKNTEHIVNQYRGTAPAVVQAEVELNGEIVLLRRQGRYGDGLLEWTSEDARLFGDAAERRLQRALLARPGQDVRRLLLTSALLQQDVVREVLEDKPATRYEQLAGLLGLDDVSAFDSEARARAVRLAGAAKEARAAVQSAQRTADGLRSRLGTLTASRQLDQDTTEVRRRVLQRLRDVDPEVRLAAQPESAADAARLRGESQAAGEQLSELLASAASLAGEEKAIRTPTKEELDRCTSEVAKVREELQAAERQHERVRTLVEALKEKSTALAALAAQAVDLLGDTCPVCQQGIDESKVRRHLKEVMSGASGSEPLAAAVEDERSARAHVDAAQEQLRAAETRLAPLTALQAEAAAFARRRGEWRRALQSFGEASNGLLVFSRLEAIRAGDIGALERTRDALRVVWSVAVDLVSVLRNDQGEREAAGLRSALTHAEEALRGATEQASLLSAQEAAAKAFSDATTRAATAVTARRFTTLAPVVQDIYSRMDPHPSFQTLEFDLDVYNRKGIASPIVVDEDRAIRADPLLVFSSSQANVTALSYFLAVGWAAGDDALPFVLLDDPLQSMDDINALGFADLCRHIRRQRQMIISTHDKRLGALLERKLAPRLPMERTLVLDFRAWSRDGPQIEERVVEPQTTDGSLRSVVVPTAA